VGRSGKQFVVSDARKLCRYLMDAVNDVVLVMDPSTSRVIAANTAAARAYGYSKKEMLGKSLSFLTRDTADYSHALRSGRSFERTDINSRGEKLEFLVSLSLINYWGRRAVLSINRDISDSKRIYAAIAAHEKKLRLVLQGISEIIAILDEAGTGRFISPQVQRVLDIPANTVRGHNVFEFVHPDDRDRASAEFSKTVSEPGEAVPSIVRLRSHEGQWVPFEVIANNQLLDPDIKGVIFTARDLRFRIEAEQAVRRANAGFDRQLEERTMELP